MSCPRNEQVVAYLFGEEQDGFADHLAGCEACQEALADAAESVDAIAPAFHPKDLVETDKIPDVVARKGAANWPLLVAAVLGLAAAVMVAVRPFEAPVVVEPDVSWEEPLEIELDALSAELDDLEIDLEEL
ncbi:MAG TPA: hypothetical protein QGF58_27020 [Myxococcota bacterium]|nr:hypothetical protein [Myxococcota bacterium]